MREVALFPIPNAVSFPWVPSPLHVFEPRYRQMVRHCLDNSMMIGVCHTEKLLHSVTPSSEQTREEVLSTNQSTYKPCAVFSAGPVQLLNELPDGRLLIQVDNEVRLRLEEEKQTLPFSIWACEELSDVPLGAGEQEQLAQTQAKILQRLLALTHGSDQAQAWLKSDYWQTMSAQRFSFAVTGFLGLDPDTAQSLLEMTSAQQRLDAVLSMLNAR